jgi:heat shock protein HslJ
MRTRVVAVLALALVLTLTGCGDDDPDVDTGGTTAPSAADGGADELDGRTFVATGVTEDGAPRPLAAGTELRLSFADGQLGVEAGCNHLSATYTLDGEALRAEGFGGTEMGCDPALMDQDTWIAEVLARPATVALDGPTLTITAGATVLTLTDREVAAPDAALVGTAWTLDTLLEGTGPDGTAGSVPGDVVATLTFADDGTYAVDTGCNTGSGSYAAEGDVLTVDPPALSRRGCPGPGAEVEAALVTVLDGEVAHEITEQRLTLTNGDRGVGFTAA